MSKKKRIKKLFNPETYEGFMPNEQVLAENDLREEAVREISQRMRIDKREALTRYEMWVYEL